MNLFIASILDDKAILNEEESHHLYKVLRLKVEDDILVTNGNGKIFYGKVLEINKKQVLVDLIEEKNPGLIVPPLTIAFAPTKSNDRSETLIEKAVELGAQNIFPIISHHSERRKINKDRWQKIADAAMKQSLKAYRCHIHELQDFSNFLSLKKFQGNKYIAHCNNEYNTTSITTSITPKKENLILIGPEGDFSSQEIKSAIEMGYRSISFGEQRLRTETAGIFFSSVHNFINQQ